MELASLKIASPQGIHALSEYVLPFNVESIGNHFNYRSQVKAKDNRVFSIKISPNYSNGTLSLLDITGSARVEISEVRENDFMKYRIAYCDTVTSQEDLGREIVFELTKALIWLKVINDFDLIQLEFKQNNRLCFIAA